MSTHLNYDDHDAFRLAFTSWPHSDCGGVGAYAVVPGTGDHYGAVICNTCGSWLAWIPWPPRSKAEEKRRRSKPLTILDTDACWYCGRTKDDCDLLGLKLERAHTIERARLIDAGLPPDDPLNLPVLCSECHADQHRKRELVARYDKAMGRVG